MVFTCLMPSGDLNCCHMADENCVPLSDVRVVGTTNLASQANRKTAEQVLAVISFSRIASSHLVVQSMM